MAEISRNTVNIPGIDVPAFRVGYGTYHLMDKMNASEAIDSLGQAFEAGINLYDTSDNYGTELVIGRAVSAGVLPRDEVIIATKTGLGTTATEQRQWKESGRDYNTEPDRIRRQVDNSLMLLGDDVGIIDIYQLHVRDPRVDHLSHAEVMQELIEEGKIRSWGVSNYSLDDLRDLIMTCKENELTLPSTTQPFHSLLEYKSAKQIDLAKSMGIVVLSHSPLVKGVLTDNRLKQVVNYLEGVRSEGSDKDKAIVDNLEPITRQVVELSRLARMKRINLAKLALAWTLRDPELITLTTPTNGKYLTEALEAMDMEIDEETDSAIDKLHSDKETLELFRAVTNDIVRRIRRY